MARGAQGPEESTHPAACARPEASQAHSGPQPSPRRLPEAERATQMRGEPQEAPQPRRRRKRNKLEARAPGPKPHADLQPLPRTAPPRARRPPGPATAAAPPGASQQSHVPPHLPPTTGPQASVSSPPPLPLLSRGLTSSSSRVPIFSSPAPPSSPPPPPTASPLPPRTPHPLHARPPHSPRHAHLLLRRPSSRQHPCDRKPRRPEHLHSGACGRGAPVTALAARMRPNAPPQREDAQLRGAGTRRRGGAGNTHAQGGAAAPCRPSGAVQGVPPQFEGGQGAWGSLPG